MRSAPLLIDKNDAAAARLQRELNTAQIGERRRDACVFFGRCVEKQGSPAPGTEQLASECAGFHCTVIAAKHRSLRCGADRHVSKCLEGLDQTACLRAHRLGRIGGALQTQSGRGIDDPQHALTVYEPDGFYPVVRLSL